MGKLDLGKVDTQKKLDEDSLENKNEAEQEEKLVSERELEELH